MEKQRNYEEMYEKLVAYEEQLHQKNQRRIKIGLKLIWIIPLSFLVLLFWTDSNKVVFLILWIVSLFGISAYLIGVEYMDYNLQEKLMELKGEEKEVEALLAPDFEETARVLQSTVQRLGQSLNAEGQEAGEESEDA